MKRKNSKSSHLIECVGALHDHAQISDPRDVIVQLSHTKQININYYYIFFFVFNSI